MTAPRRDGVDASPYHQWLRETPELDSRHYGISVTDSDHWQHKFSRSNGERYDHLMLIEVKCFSRPVPFAQNDTLDVVGQLLRGNVRNNGRRYPVRIKDSRRSGCFRLVRCYGMHILTMSGDRPDTSSRLWWDGKRIFYHQLIGIYRFELDPDHPSRFMDTRRHHLKPAKELNPSLPFLVFES